MKAILFLAFLILAISATSTAYVIKHEYVTKHEAEAGNLVKRNVEADKFGNIAKRDFEAEAGNLVEQEPIISAVRNLVLPPKPQQTNNPNGSESNNRNGSGSNRQNDNNRNLNRQKVAKSNNPNGSGSNSQNGNNQIKQNVIESRQITTMPVNISVTDEAEAGNLAKREPIISAVRNLVTRILPPKPQQTNNPNVSESNNQNGNNQNLNNNPNGSESNNRNGSGSNSQNGNNQNVNKQNVIEPRQITIMPVLSEFRQITTMPVNIPTVTVEARAEAGNLVKREPIISAVRNLVTRILPPKPQQTNNPNATESRQITIMPVDIPTVTDGTTDEARAEAGNLVKREPIISAIRNLVTRILPPKPQQTNNPNVTESNNQNMTESNNQNVTESNNSTESRQITIMPVNISMTDEAEAGNLAKREPIISAVRNLVTRILPPKPQQTNNRNVTESRQITIMPVDIPTVTDEARAEAGNLVKREPIISAIRNLVTRILPPKPQQTNNPNVTESQQITVTQINDIPTED